MARHITLRIEVVIVLIVLVLCVFMAEFPISPSFFCSNTVVGKRDKNGGTTTDAPVVTAAESQQQQQEHGECPKPVPAPPCPYQQNQQQQQRQNPSPPPAPQQQQDEGDTSKKQQQQQSSSPSSSIPSTIHATLEAEREVHALLTRTASVKGGETGASSSRLLSLEETMEQELAALSPFIRDRDAQKAILDGAAAAAKAGHRQYALFSRSLRNISMLARAGHVRDQSSSGPSATARSNTKKVELFRFQTSLEDDKLTVPSIPTDLQNLAVIAPTNFGLVAGFHRPSKQPAIDNETTSAAAAADSGGLRVATLLTGHMRSYRRCAERLRTSVLEPTQSRLFIASYADAGEKRYGIREQVSNDDVVDWREVQRIYSPEYLTGIFIGEVPLIRRRLELAFPNAFTNKQFSWMLYQFLLIEAGFNMTEAYAAGWDFSANVVGEMSFGAWKRASQQQQQQQQQSSSSLIRGGLWPWGHLWGDCGKDGAVDGSCSLLRFGQATATTVASRGFDVFIRLRPDLFVIGTVRLVGFSFSKATTSAAAAAGGEEQQQQQQFDNFQLQLTCGNEPRTERNYPPETTVASFDDSVVLVTPHHPRNEWYLDRTSDLSLVSTFATARRYLSMYSFLSSRLTLKEQDVVFNPLCTAERLWNKRAKDLGLLQNRTFGWFVMLRNATTFRMSSNDGSNVERKRRWIRSIFAIVDPDKVPCPFVNGTMLTLPPKKKGDNKKSGGKKRS